MCFWLANHSSRYAKENFQEYYNSASCSLQPPTMNLRCFNVSLILTTLCHRSQIDAGPTERVSGLGPTLGAMVVSWPTVSIATIALSLTLQPQFTIECLWRSNQQGASLWVKILG